MRSNRGQMNLGMLQVVGVIFVTVTVILGIGGLILSSIKTTVTTEDTVTLLFRNQTITATNLSTIAVNIEDSTLIGSYKMYNKSAWNVSQYIGSTGNYSLSGHTLTISVQKNSTDSTFGYTSGDTWYFTWNETFYETSAYNATRDGEKGTNKLASWMPTIALVIAAAIVIAVIIGALGKREQ